MLQRTSYSQGQAKPEPGLRYRLYSPEPVSIDYSRYFSNPETSEHFLWRVIITGLQDTEDRMQISACPSPIRLAKYLYSLPTLEQREAVLCLLVQIINAKPRLRKKIIRTSASGYLIFLLPSPLIKIINNNLK